VSGLLFLFQRLKGLETIVAVKYALKSSEHNS
jgi:hypothetical protein